MPGDTDKKSGTGYVKRKESGVATLERIQNLDLKPLIEQRRVEKWAIVEPQVKSFYQGFLDQMFGPGYKFAPEKLASATYSVKKDLAKAQTPNQFPIIIENGIEELKNPFEDQSAAPKTPVNDIVQQAEQVAVEHIKKTVADSEVVPITDQTQPALESKTADQPISISEDAKPDVKPKDISEKEIDKKVDAFIVAHSQELEESAVYENLGKTLNNPNKEKIINDELDSYAYEISPLDSQSAKEEVKDSNKIADLSEEELIQRLTPILQNNQPITLEQVTEIKDESFDSAVAKLAAQTKDPNLSSPATDIGTGLGYKIPDESYLQSRSLRAATIPMLSFANMGGSETAEVAIGMAASQKVQERAFYYLLSRDKKFAAMVDSSSDPNLKRLKAKALSSARESHQHHLAYQAFFQQVPGGEARAQSVVRRSVQSHFAGPVVVSSVIYQRMTADTMGSLASNYNVPVYYSVPSGRGGGTIFSSSMHFVGGGFSSIRKTAKGIKTVKKLAKTAKMAGTAAKTAGTLAKTGAIAAEATNPVGWAMLAVQAAPILKKIAKVAVGIAVYLMIMYGLKFLGAAAGFVFGAVTGLPLLFLGPPGWAAYVAWVAGWTTYGLFKPMNMLNITMHPLATVAKLIHTATDLISGSIGAVSSFATGSTLGGAIVGAGTGATIGFVIAGPLGAVVGAFIGAGTGYLLSGGAVQISKFLASATGTSASAMGGAFASIGTGITGLASTIWGGALSAGGTILGGAAYVGSSIWGAITGGSISTAFVAIPLATTFGTITIGSVLVGITVGAAFFDPPNITILLDPGISENDYFTLEKTVDPTAIPEILDSPQNILFTIRLEAKEDISNISIEDVFLAVGSNTTIELGLRCRTLPGEEDPENPDLRSMAAGDIWTCVFEETVEDDWLDTIVKNTVTVSVQAGDPTDEVLGSASARVRVGSPPASCPQGWPTFGAITQGPEGFASHTLDSDIRVGERGNAYEALDIGGGLGVPVYATFDGKVVGYRRAQRGQAISPLNKVIQLRAVDCDNLFVEYVHLRDIAPFLRNPDGSLKEDVPISFGQYLGTQGHPGGGPHLHYQLNETNVRTVKVTDSVPIAIPRSCNGVTACGVTATIEDFWFGAP